MSELLAVLPVIAGGIAGAITGTIFGFALASHRDVLVGLMRKPSNRFIAFVARPSSEFSSFESLAYLALLLIWCIVLLALCALPILVAQLLVLPAGWWLPGAYVTAFLAYSLSFPIGKRLWLRCS